jgi:SAM-dependent methyltransferase
MLPAQRKCLAHDVTWNRFYVCASLVLPSRVNRMSFTDTGGSTPLPTAPDSMWSVANWVSVQLRREALVRHVPRSSRVLELRAGAGHFTEVLHGLGCRITVANVSPVELQATRAYAAARGFANRIEAWHQSDAVALDGIPDGAYDVIVAYNGVFSYAARRREQALAECRRVLRQNGILVLDVLSLWGTLHRHLPRIVGHQNIAYNRAVIRDGDVRAPSREYHLFRAAELRAFLSNGGFKILSLFASSVISTGREVPRWSDPNTWMELLEYERAASLERGCLDCGRRLVAVVRRY